jgi:hypothetical protein
MKQVCSLLFASQLALGFVAIVLSPDFAAAEGALAMGLPNDVAKDGFTYGYSYDKASTRQAQAEALFQCRKTKDSALRSLCKVIATYHDQCVAVAMDPDTGTSGVGWSIAVNLPSAEADALAKCKETDGPAHADKCVIDNSQCDGSPPRPRIPDSGLIQAPGPAGTHR